MQISKSKAAKILNGGGVIGIATDTVFGFAALPQFAEEIYALKQRDPGKKLINFIHTYKQVGEVDDLTENEMKKITEEHWPGAVTLIFNQNSELVSYRIPAQGDLLNFLEDLNEIIVTTSANISGEPPCLNASEFERRFSDIPLLEVSSNIEMSQEPSTIYLVEKAKLKQMR